MPTPTLAPFALLLALASVPLACVGRPSMQPRLDKKGDLLEPNIPQIENPPAVAENPSRTAPSGVPEEAYPTPLPLESTTGTLVATGGEANETVEPTSSLEEESGSGVNNGIGPTGSYLTCKGTEASLVIRGTAAITYIQGALNLGGEYQSLSCKEGTELEPWTCRSFDLPLLVRVIKSENGILKGLVLETITEGVESQVDEMTCVKPKK